VNPDLKRAVMGFVKDRGYPADDVRIERLAGDGSRRVFWRVATDEPSVSFIAMANPPDDPALRCENDAYLKINRHLCQKGVPVPRIYQYDLASGWFIMADLGTIHLCDAAASADDPLSLYKQVVTQLFHMQTEGAVGFNPAWCCQTGRYDRSVMLPCEAHYFRDAFLTCYLGMAGDHWDLDRAFHCLVGKACEADSRFFLHRDFQSRNIMLCEGRIGFVDWQGARLGPLGYDVASLVIDPYTRLSAAERDAVYRHYLALVRERHPDWLDNVVATYPYLAVQRNMQILGAFSHLTQVVGKTYFETYIPDALRTLHSLLNGIADPGISRLRDLTEDLLSHKKILDIAKGGR
jgi:N-acetylmuramate 1-kinase